MLQVIRLSGLLGLAALLGWAPAPCRVDTATVRHALAVFSEAPLAPEAGKALADITAFADASDAIAITISETSMPWLTDNHAAKHKDLVLGAYIAGNVRSQLDSGVTRDDPYAGLLQVFAVYRALRERQSGFFVPPLDALLNRHKRGELASWLATQAAPASARPNAAGGKGAVAGYVPPAGLVPDADTAIRIAVAVWEPIYGKDEIAGEKPYVATLDADTWTVVGSLPEGWLGGVAEARIDREDGRVLYVMHGK